MANYAWLYNYTSHYVANTYGIAIQTADYDGAEKFHLESKEKIGALSIEESEKLKNLKQLSSNFTKSWTNYEFIPSQEMPIRLFKQPDVDHYKNLPNKEEVFFRIINGYLIMNEKLHNTISQFNLGKTHFSEVYIYDIETKEKLLDTPYYFINIAENFEFLDNKNSLGIRPSMYTPNEPDRFITSPKDDDIIISKKILTIDIDMWHDPILHGSLFLSDSLVKKILQNGFTKKELGLVRCQVA